MMQTISLLMDCARHALWLSAANDIRVRSKTLQRFKRGHRQISLAQCIWGTPDEHLPLSSHSKSHF